MQNIFFPIELITALLIYVPGLEKRKSFCVRCLAVAALLVLSAKIWTLQNVDLVADNMQERHAIALVTVFACLQIFLYMGLLVWIPFRVSMVEALYCIACAYLTEHIAYCIRLLANGLAGRDITRGGSMLYFLIHGCVYVVSYYIFARKMTTDNHYATSALQSLGLLVATLFVVLGMSVAATMYGFETIHAIYASFSCIFVLYSQLKLQKQLGLQEELNNQKQLWMRYKAQYEMSKETIDIINSKCHDLKHQVAALKTIDNPVKRTDVIESIENSVMIYDSMPKTGNGILDTVLTEKNLLCNQKKITMTCITDGGLLDFMDAVDIYTLFGNALDNAMEGVEGLPEEERFISLLLHKKAGLIFIQVENRYQGQITMQDGLPATTKQDKNYHGFGLKSILRIVEKYHGFATIETEQQIFLLRLTIQASG